MCVNRNSNKFTFQSTLNINKWLKFTRYTRPTDNGTKIIITFYTFSRLGVRKRTSSLCIPILFKMKLDCSFYNTNILCKYIYPNPRIHFNKRENELQFWKSDTAASLHIIHCDRPAQGCIINFNIFLFFFLSRRKSNS